MPPDCPRRCAVPHVDVGRSLAPVGRLIEGPWSPMFNGVVRPPPQNWLSEADLDGFGAVSVVRSPDKYYMFYNPLEASPVIHRASSSDLLHWTKEPAKCCLKPEKWYQDGPGCAWRDPFVFRDPESGQHVMLITAATPASRSEHFRRRLASGGRFAGRGICAVRSQRGGGRASDDRRQNPRPVAQLRSPPGRRRSRHWRSSLSASRRESANGCGPGANPFSVCPQGASPGLEPSFVPRVRGAGRRPVRLPAQRTRNPD